MDEPRWRRNYAGEALASAGVSVSREGVDRVRAMNPILGGPINRPKEGQRVESKALEQVERMLEPIFDAIATLSAQAAGHHDRIERLEGIAPFEADPKSDYARSVEEEWKRQHAQEKAMMLGMPDLISIERLDNGSYAILDGSEDGGILAGCADMDDVIAWLAEHGR